MQNILEGLDTSRYQGVVHWRDAYLAGKRFGIPQATYGISGTDPEFPASWGNLHHVAMPRIAYHFFYDVFDGIEQCDHLHRYVRNNGRFWYGDALAVDVEEISVTNARLCLARLTDFIKHAWQSSAKPVWIYTNADTWINLLGDPVSDVFSKCPLWLASIGPNVAPLKAWPNGPSIVQYAFGGHSPGVDGVVDLDRFYGSMTQLQKIMHTIP